MRKHPRFLLLVSLILVVATLEITTPQVYAAPPKAQPEFTLCGLLVLIVVAAVAIVIFVGLKKMCDRIPPPNPPDPNTNDITVAHPMFSTYTGPPLRSLQFTFDASSATNAYAFTQPVQDNAGNTYDAAVFYTLQSSTDLDEWTVEGTMTQWLGGTTTTNGTDGPVVGQEVLSIQESAFYNTNGVLFYAYRGTNIQIPPVVYVPVDSAPQKFYRLTMTTH